MATVSINKIFELKDKEKMKKLIKAKEQGGPYKKQSDFEIEIK